MIKTLCIIPARGGSKRIPRKNIRPLHGRPLIAWSIAAAQQAELFDEIMVSTEDEEIAGIAREARAAVPFLRSSGAATDHASTTDVLREVLANYAACGHGEIEKVCCLYPTAVLIEAEHLRAGFRLLEERPGLDSSMAVQAYRHPIERAYRLRDGLVAQVDIALHAVRTQDLQPAYHDAGQFYWFRPVRLGVTGRVLGESCAPVLLEPWQAVDLDDEADWKFLERLAAGRAPAAWEVRL